MKAVISLVTSLSFLLTGFMPSVYGKLAQSRPNIILVMTDDQGMGDLSCMGNQILQTPNLDRFHSQSTRFTDFQVSPTCAPTRAAMMSGRFPFEVGISHTILQRERMALHVTTLPQALQKAGYKTGLFGKWHLGDSPEYLPQNRGFNEVLMHGAGGIGQYAYGDFKSNLKSTYFDSILLHNQKVVRSQGFCTDVFFDASIHWVKQQLNSKNPFFAYISLNAPHSPFIAPQKYKQRFLDEGYDQNTAGRYGMIENIDDNFGKLMSKLEEWQALENTLVIFMTDNGMAMPRIKKGRQSITPFNAGLKGAKAGVDEGGTHVPAFWRWKGVLKEGHNISALTAHIDLYPTLCELADISIPKTRLTPNGRSLIPLLENPKAEWKDRTLYFHRGRWDDGRWDFKEREKHRHLKCAVRTQRWRWVDNQYLYDIQNDPFQKKNIASQHPEIMSEIRAKYDRWWDSLGPLLINEGLGNIEPEDHHFPQLETIQLAKGKIPIYQINP